MVSIKQTKQRRFNSFKEYVSLSQLIRPKSYLSQKSQWPLVKLVFEWTQLTFNITYGSEKIEYWSYTGTKKTSCRILEMACGDPIRAQCLLSVIPAFGKHIQYTYSLPRGNRPSECKTVTVTLGKRTSRVKISRLRVAATLVSIDRW